MTRVSICCLSLGLPLGTATRMVRESFASDIRCIRYKPDRLYMSDRTSPGEAAPALLWTPHLHPCPSSPCLLPWPLSIAPPVLFFRLIPQPVSRMGFHFALQRTPLSGPCSSNWTRLGYSKARRVLLQAPPLLSAFQNRCHLLAFELIHSEITLYSSTCDINHDCTRATLSI